MADVVTDAIALATLPLVHRLKALERREAELEQQPPGVEYAGIYTPEKAYTRGSLVTRFGGLWLCLKDTTAVTLGSNPPVETDREKGESG
jgi:hypothetical protein